jgi:carboxyvinyl-carboxyphosphonate phosphorylmutase
MPIPDFPRPLRQILCGTGCVTASSLFDPISARIADSLGFEVGVIGGSVASYAVLGAPDLILLTMTELVEQARRVCRAASLRVIVDADHGYGNALNVMRTVEELQAAGVAGITIEDTLLPRAFGSSAAPQLVSLEEGVGKMKAALKARAGGEALVFGRTSAASITGVDDAIRRLLAYEAVGVDALFVPGLKRREDLDRIADAVKLPLILGGGGEALADPQYLASRGVRIWLWGHQPFTAAVKALHDAMKAVRDGATPGALAEAAPESLLKQFTRAAGYDALTKDFLGG